MSLTQSFVKFSRRFTSRRWLSGSAASQAFIHYSSLLQSLVFLLLRTVHFRLKMRGRGAVYHTRSHCSECLLILSLNKKFAHSHYRLVISSFILQWLKCTVLNCYHKGSISWRISVRYPRVMGYPNVTAVSTLNQAVTLCNSAPLW